MEYVSYVSHGSYDSLFGEWSQKYAVPVNVVRGVFEEERRKQGGATYEDKFQTVARIIGRLKSWTP